jgi:hypothetical protein
LARLRYVLRITCSDRLDKNTRLRTHKAEDESKVHKQRASQVLYRYNVRKLERDAVGMQAAPRHFRRSHFSMCVQHLVPVANQHRYK